MAASIRHRLSAIAGIITLVIGLVFVAAIQMIVTLFQEPAASSQSRVFDQPLVVRPGDNIEPITQQQLELSCYDPHILPIWNELKKDESFKDWTEHIAGSLNCSDLLDIGQVDLNEDGAPEFLVKGKDVQMCSAVGNCGFWIFELRKSRASILLSSTDYPGEAAGEFGLQVQPKSSRGYSNILLEYHFTAAETGYTTYSFDGRSYVESRCVFEVPKYRRDGEGSRELISCKEFDRRLQNGTANTDLK